MLLETCVNFTKTKQIPVFPSYWAICGVCTVRVKRGHMGIFGIRSALNWHWWKKVLFGCGKYLPSPFPTQASHSVCLLELGFRIIFRE